MADGLYVEGFQLRATSLHRRFYPTTIPLPGFHRIGPADAGIQKDLVASFPPDHKRSKVNFSIRQRQQAPCFALRKQ
ncbi:MAG TPA: hypothetical protein VKR53_20430 [Puia sp.]|nr:hypothetical protein [Puia sp.]